MWFYSGFQVFIYIFYAFSVSSEQHKNDSRDEWEREELIDHNVVNITLNCPNIIVLIRLKRKRWEISLRLSLDRRFMHLFFLCSSWSWFWQETHSWCIRDSRFCLWIIFSLILILLICWWLHQKCAFISLFFGVIDFFLFNCSCSWFGLRVRVSTLCFHKLPSAAKNCCNYFINFSSFRFLIRLPC